MSKAKNGGAWKERSLHELHVYPRRYCVWVVKEPDAQLQLAVHIRGCKAFKLVWKASVEQPLMANGRSTGIMEVLSLGNHTTKKKAMAACRKYQQELVSGK